MVKKLSKQYYQDNIDVEDDDEAPPARWEPIRRPEVHVKQTKKTSYESNADVQRWLKEQGVDVNQPAVFNPTFLSSQRDAPWILSSLTPLYEQKLILDILHVVKSGKEATVFCCAAHPDTGRAYLAVKVYRPRMFRSLKNDADYRNNRTQRDEQGQVAHGDNRLRGVARKTARGQAARVQSWIEYEFETQNRLFQAGVHVPHPLAYVGNAVLMDYIGTEGNAAPLLRDVRLNEDEAQPLFDCLLADIELCLANGRIHGDLSEYNILYWQGAVTIIDFAQAVDTIHDEVFPIFARDVERVCQYFARYGLEHDAEQLAAEIWTRHMGGRVEDIVL
ncbi:RIO1 family regulatory kinase/ATPase domain-containing protein [Dictyobacter formicarum]|uniref:non-specific serine/threonine protein kinase n=1 Tax=Dictyobacter formicarum TaxID=2778368 RepID=A0ABQ3VBJ1_9CHLR|nr:RIO1 family regulatory kinase/ATPase [Dictyobacter formicarum]GHO83525.1 hypothetical protein KSZ_15310 [Dictyobacter formicarum]